MRKLIIFLLLAAAALFGLLAALAPEKAAEETRSQDSNSGPEWLAPQSPQSASTSVPEHMPISPVEASSTPKQIRLEVGETGLVNGPSVIRAQQGQSIELLFHSSITDELHLHGYDRHLHLTPGHASVLKLNLTLSGRFDYELHGRNIELGALEVLPNN